MREDLQQKLLPLAGAPQCTAGRRDRGPKGREKPERSWRRRQGLGTFREPSLSHPRHTTVVSAGGERTPGGVKRRKDADSTPPANPASKRPNIETDVLAARVVDPLTRAVICEGYPDEELTAQQLALVSESVQAEVDKIDAGQWPEFDDSFVKLGAIIVLASNTFSRDWLEEITPRLRPWKGAKLALVEMSALRKPRRAKRAPHLQI
ncbi:hypothetical protein TSAR_010409 [Trichomalopsis sarcophagae]|uniref:DUF4780 domain-containing protein n=1 Tax=Trichomalopsis sarcophagae TaxID=543379 RepID=A0A232FC29_9HYME|nr:hypothetical protein TSAR_010409 [Trichomalopsis sarcophagae]